MCGRDLARTRLVCWSDGLPVLLGNDDDDDDDDAPAAADAPADASVQSYYAFVLLFIASARRLANATKPEGTLYDDAVR